MFLYLLTKLNVPHTGAIPFTFGVHLVQSSLSAAAQLNALKQLLQVVLTVPVTSLGPSPQSSTPCQQTFPCCTVCLVWLALGARKILYAQTRHKYQPDHH